MTKYTLKDILIYFLLFIGLPILVINFILNLINLILILIG